MDVQQLKQAIQVVWKPDATAESAVKRAAAECLAAVPNHTASSSRVATHVGQAVGNVSSLGIKQSFRQLLGSDPCFTLSGATLDEAYITLDTAQLLSQQSWRQRERPTHPHAAGHVRQQHPQGQLRQPASRSAAGNAATAAPQQALHGDIKAAISTAWPEHGNSVEARVWRAAALFLAEQSPNTTSTSSGVAKAVHQRLGRNLKDLGCSTSFAGILRQQPGLFRFSPGPSAHEACIALSEAGIAELLRLWRQRQQQQQQPQPAPPPPSLRPPPPPPLQPGQAFSRQASSSSSRSAAPIMPGHNSAVSSPTSSYAAVLAGANAAEHQHGVADASNSASSSSWAAATAAVNANFLLEAQMKLLGRSTSAGSGSFAAGGVPAGGPGRSTAPMRWQQAVLEALEPSSQAVAAAADGRLSVSRLSWFVTNRVWHSGNPQLHTARRALAEHLVQKANPGDPNQAANTQADAYITPCPQAGTVMLKAIQAQFGAAVQRCYKSMSQAVDGDRYLSTFISGPSEKSVCLNIKQLLQDAAQGLQGQQHEAAGLAAPAEQHSSTAGSSSSIAEPQRATGSINLQDGPGAAVGAATTAAVPAAGFERTASSSSAAESAAAALRAAAESLMPPAVSSTASTTPHALLPANPAATHCVAQPQSSSTAAAAAAGAGAAPQGCTAAVQEAAVGTVSPCKVRQPPGFPPWLNPLQTSRPVSDSQLRAPSNAQREHPDDSLKELAVLFEAGSNSSTDGSSSPEVTPARQHTAQQQPVQQSQLELSHSPQQASAAAAAAGRASGAAAAAVPGSCEGADRGSMDVPLQYQLILQNSSTPGWYTAEYVVTDAVNMTDQPQQASGAGGIQQDSQGGVVGEGAAGPAAAAAAMATPSILQILPDRLHSDLLPYLSRPPGRAPRLSRILVSRGQPVTLRFSNRTALTLSTHVTLSEALQQLLAAQQQWSATQQQQPREEGRLGQSCEMPAADTAETGDRDSTSSSSSSSSSSSASSSNGSSSRNDTHHERDVQLANGSSKTEQQPSSSRHNDNSRTLKGQYTGGHVEQGQGVSAAVGLEQSKDDSELQRAAARLFSSGCVGIPFSCHRVCAVTDASGAISGLTYCIDTQPPGSAQGLADLLSSMKASLLLQEQQGQQEDGTGMDRPHSLLLLGRPGAGKASLLRNICRLMSGPPDAGGLGLDVMLIDIAGHVAGVAAEPCTAIGQARLLSAPVRSQQAQLMMDAAVQHQPDVLVVAELNTQQDVVAAAHIARSRNVLLVAAVPAAAGLEVLLADATLCPLAGCERATIGDGSSSCFSNQVAMQRVRPSPFAFVLEVAAADRLRLHLDVQASVDEMLATHSFGGSSRSQQQQQHTVSRSRYAPQMHFSQLRTRDSAGHWTVHFASPAAAAQGLAAAGLLHSTVRSLAAPI